MNRSSRRFDFTGGNLRFYLKFFHLYVKGRFFCVLGDVINAVSYHVDVLVMVVGAASMNKEEVIVEAIAVDSTPISNDLEDPSVPSRPRMFHVSVRCVVAVRRNSYLTVGAVSDVFHVTFDFPVRKEDRFSPQDLIRWVVGT